MALISISLVLLAFSLFVFGQLCLGSWALRKLQLEFESFPEHFLISVCSGIMLTEIAIFLLQWTQHIRAGSFLVLLLSCAAAGIELPNLWRRAKRFVLESQPSSREERFVLWITGTVLLLEFVASLAPLTGSDIPVPRLSNRMNLWLRRSDRRPSAPGKLDATIISTLPLSWNPSK